MTVFSQYGNPVYIKLIRDRDSGKSKGYGFLKYADQRSTVLAVDNLNGANVLGRPIRVDHTRFELKNDEDKSDFDLVCKTVIEASKHYGGKPMEHIADDDDDDDYNDDDDDDDDPSKKTTEDEKLKMDLDPMKNHLK